MDTKLRYAHSTVVSEAEFPPLTLPTLDFIKCKFIQQNSSLSGSWGYKFTRIQLENNT